MALNVKIMDGVKKDKEWLVLQYFREKYADFPKGRLLKSESPDFILKQGRKRSIGIELTQLDIGQKNHDENWTELLEDLLLKKESKLSLYKKRILNEYWLLIAIENIGLLEIDLCNIKVDSGFNRVIMFDIFTGKIKELNL